MKKAILIVLLVIVLLAATAAGVFYFGSGYLIDKAFEKALDTPPQNTARKTDDSTTPSADSANPPSNNSAASEPNSTPQDKATLFSNDYIAAVKDKLTSKDKAEIATIVVKSLSLKDIQYLTGLLDGGISSSEAKEAEQLITSKLTKEQIDSLMKYYDKYK